VAHGRAVGNGMVSASSIRTERAKTGPPSAVQRDELAARQNDADLHGPVSPRNLGLVREISTRVVAPE
jgi:hypothetical protein